MNEASLPAALGVAASPLPSLRLTARPWGARRRKPTLLRKKNEEEEEEEEGEGVEGLKRREEGEKGKRGGRGGGEGAVLLFLTKGEDEEGERGTA